MGYGISQVLTFAVGVAISPIPIVAVILMLFSRSARVNGPVFLGGWVLALGVVSGIGYALADQTDAATTSAGSDTVSWGRVVLGVLLLAMAARQWRSRPAPGVEPAMPSWMSRVEAFRPAEAFGLAVLLAGVNPKNLVLSLAAGAALAQAGVSGSDAAVSLVAYVVVASLTIAAPVLYHRLGGDRAAATLDRTKDWLRLHNAAVMAMLFLVFGVDLVAKGLGPLTR